jgi:F0F1-type ATP synthase membrane subunit c/vacuolar-type H+-ATPase subunit K
VATSPLRDELAKACRAAQVVGAALLISLGMYAFAIDQIQRTRAPFTGFAPGVPHGLLRAILAACALAGLGLARVLQRLILANAALPPLARLNSAAIVALALCEATAIYGFTLFMLAGRPSDYYLFAALALVGFLFYFPRREAWEERAREMARDTTGPQSTPPRT